MADHTKEELFALGAELGLKNEDLISLFRKYGIHGLFDDSLWDRYMKALENYKKNFCEICGKKLVVDPEYVLDKDHLRCPESVRHSTVHYMADLVQGLMGVDREIALAKVQGEICEHGLKLVYCDPCLEVKKAIKMQIIMAKPNPNNFGYPPEEK